MGEVYAGKDLETNHRVALKLLHQPLCAVERQVRRFEREFHLTSEIDHPHVVRSLAFGRQPDGPLAGRHYLVMEFLEGRGLDKVIAEGPLPVDSVVHMARQVASALAAVHARDVIHRDLKPGNLPVLSRGEAPLVKVMDFGLGRLEGGDQEQLTDVGIRLGTVEYMAPEYIARHELDTRADLYSLGCVMYEMLVGQPPFSGRALQVMQDQVATPAPRISQRVVVPEWLDELVAALRAKAPEERPAGAAEVERMLLAQAQTPKPRGRAQRTRPPPPSSLPPAGGLASVAHLGEAREPVYPEASPSVPATPMLVTVGLGFAAAFGMVCIGFLVGLVVLALR